MDLNSLFSRHQTALMRAQHAACPAMRARSRAGAALYAAEIDEARRRSGALWQAGAPA